MTLNSDLVGARCGKVDAALTRLEQFRTLSREKFLSCQDQLDIACYRLLVATEAALALCFHISAKQLHQVPKEYMARFRNLLIHVYWTIDYNQVYDIICTRLDDLRLFSSAIAGRL